MTLSPCGGAPFLDRQVESATLVSIGKPGTASTRAEGLRIGVISDTHGLLRPEAIAALRGSDHIVLAGDIGDSAILDGLAALAPRDRRPRQRTG